MVVVGGIRALPIRASPEVHHQQALLMANIRGRRDAQMPGVAPSCSMSSGFYDGKPELIWDRVELERSSFFPVHQPLQPDDIEPVR